jgi:2-keto-3-deoxy-L-rhamnonate aldolase RhmA
MTTLFGNSLKTRIQARERLLGALNFTGSYKMIELFGLAGFDFITIDTEHTVVNWETVDHMLLAAKVVGLPALVRIGTPNEQEILRALDSGAAGVVISHVSSEAEADRAVRAVKYPRRGLRSMCPGIRTTAYGAQKWHDYTPIADASTVVVCLIEDVAGLESVEAIAAVDGVDVVWCGTGDLSQSLGIPHSGLEHPKIEAAMTRCREACSNNGKVFMATAGSSPTPEYVAKLWEFGAPIVSMGPDVMILRNMLSELVTKLTGERHHKSAVAVE